MEARQLRVISHRAAEHLLRAGVRVRVRVRVRLRVSYPYP